MPLNVGVSDSVQAIDEIDPLSLQCIARHEQRRRPEERADVVVRVDTSQDQRNLSGEPVERGCEPLELARKLVVKKIARELQHKLAIRRAQTRIGVEQGSQLRAPRRSRSGHRRRA